MNQIKIVEKNTIKHFSTLGLALFLFFTPFEYPMADLMSISPLRIIGMLAMALAFVDILMQKTIKFDYRIILITLWLLFATISYIWAIDKTRFELYYSIYLNNAIMFLLLSFVSFTKYEAEILKKSMIFGIGALLLYMTFIPGAVVYSDYQHRLALKTSAGNLDQNYLAALMLISFGIVFFNLCNTKQKKIYKLISIVFCCAIAYYTLLTGSRSGLIAITIILIISINTSWKTRLSIGIPIILVIFIVLPIITQYLPEGLLDRFTLKALTGQEDESGSRLLIWEQAFRSIDSVNIFFGNGTGSSQTVIGNAMGNGKDMAIHNHYIAMLVEFGITGFLLINLPILKMITGLWRKDKGIVIAFSGILLMACFLDVLTTKFFWSAMILLSAVCTSQSQKSDI